MQKRVGLGLLGCGNVGGAVVTLLAEQHELFRRRHGLDMQLLRVAVRDAKKSRPAALDRSLLTTDIKQVVGDAKIATVIELIGGVDVAYDAVKRALNAGKHVVTGNKSMLALHGPELLDLAHQNGVQLRFEAAVGGGVPIIGALSEGLAANSIESITAIVNGTTNFILSQMTLHGASYEDALAEAQRRGLAEPDPRFDVEGRDSAQKLAILGALAFGVQASEAQIPTQGITDLSRDDVESAARFDYSIKLLAIARRTHAGIELRVNPGLLPNGTFLATVQDEFNAFLVTGHATGEVVLVGRGAGARPTAGAVLADVVEVAIRSVDAHPVPTYTWTWNQARLIDPADSETGYYLRFPVLDQPGVIGTLTTLLGKHGINIDSASARQDTRAAGGVVEILSRRARTGAVERALQEISGLDIIRERPRQLRIEEWRPAGGYF